MPFLEQTGTKAGKVFPISGQALQVFEESFARLLAVVEERLSLQLKASGESFDERQRDLLKDLYRKFGETVRGIYDFHLYDCLEDEAFWLASVLTSRGIGARIAERLIETWIIAIHGIIKPAQADELARPLSWLHTQIPLIFENLIMVEEKIPPDVQKYIKFALQGKRREAAEHVLSFLHCGLLPERICDDLIMPALRQIGILWQKNLISATAEHSATDITRYVVFRLFDSARRETSLPHKAIFASAPGDEHEMGLEMMAEILALKGWTVIFVGRSAPPEDIVETVRSHKPDVVLLSVSLFAHLPAARKLLQELNKKAPGTKIILGGPAALAAKTGLTAMAHAVASNLEEGCRMASDFADQNA